ncbi:MAG: FkbM family methyltransferase [Rhodospirillaceae bacterium]|nr:FkbM family methyltransferase [Rhodospirillales bacterium]
MKLDPFLTPRFHSEFRRDPLVIHDVGAAGGIYPLYRDTPADLWRAYGFEPTPASFAKLRQISAGQTNVELHELALTDHAGTADFHVYADVPTNSSLNRNTLVLEDGKAQCQVVTVTCERMDAFCAEPGRATPDFIKLDTEGTELQVLLGGQDVIAASALAVVSEIKFVHLSPEATQFSDLDAFLRGKGFMLFDIQTSRQARCVGQRFGGKKGAIDAAYVLYLRDFYSYYRSHLADKPELARIKLLKLMSLAVRYLYLDYAVELADFGRSQGLLNPDEARELLRLYTGVTDRSWSLPNFPGKAKLALLVDYVSYMLQPEMKLAVPPMFNNFGNRRSALTRQSPPSQIRLQHSVRALTDAGSVEVAIQIE